MEWDHADLMTPLRLAEPKPDESARPSLALALRSPTSSSTPSTSFAPQRSNSGGSSSGGGAFLEVHGSGAAWCSQESGYLEWEGGTPASEASVSFASATALSPLPEKRYDTKNATAKSTR